MSTPIWKLKCAAPAIDDTLEDLDIVNASLSLDSMSADRLVLVHQPPTGIEATALLPFNAVATLMRDAARFFTGRCRTIPRAGSMPGEAVRYELLGPWFDLERVTYAQRWMTVDPAYVYDPENPQPPTMIWRHRHRLILGQAEDGTAMTIAQILADIVTYAASKGALIAVPADVSAWPAIKLPWEEIANLKCSDVIVRLMAYIPDYKICFNYATEVPQLDVIPRSSATTVSLAIGTDAVTQLDITPRHDLACPGVRIYFERHHTVGGSSYDTLEIQEAGDPDHLDAIDVTLPLAGASITTQSARIVTRDLPVTGEGAEQQTDWLNKDWWIDQVPALERFQAADLELVNVEATVEPPEEGGAPPTLADLPYELVEGSIPLWLSGDVYTARVNLDLDINYTERREVDNVIVRQVREQRVSHSLILTSVPTGVYTRREGDFAEPAPDGLAAALYASWSQLQYEGIVVIELPEVHAIARPGDVLNLTGSGHADWATMQAHIQHIQFDIETGRIQLNIGPARRIEPATLLSLMRRLRARALPLNHLARLSGDPADRGNNIQGDAAAQAKETAIAGGHPTYARYEPAYDPENPPTYTRTIEIDPTDIVKANEADTAAVAIQPRRIVTRERDAENNPVLVVRHILASGPEITPTADNAGLPDGTATGDIMYWSGSAWVMLPIGSQDQVLKVANNIPAWGEGNQWPTDVITDPTHVLGRKGTSPNFTYGWVAVETFSCPT